MAYMTDWGGSDDAWGADKAALVQQVKSFQRTSPANKEAWYAFCRQKSSQSVYDPNKHSVDILMEFLSQIDVSVLPTETWAGSEDTGDTASLVEEVKKIQRTSPAHKEAWYSFVKERTGRGDKDPSRHTADVLQEFVTNASEGLIDFTAYGAGDSGDWAASTAGTDVPVMKDSLVQEVKNFQRMSPANKETWYSFCKERSSAGDKDPNRFDADVLTEFLMSVKAGKGMGKGGGSGKGMGKGMGTGNPGQWMMQMMMQMQMMMGKGMGKMGGKGKGRSMPY